MKKLNAEYWDVKHEHGETPWQLNIPSPPITAYLDQLRDKNIRVLIPGAGQGLELDYLLMNGYKHIDVCDVSLHAIERLKERVGDNTSVNFIKGDFFDLQGQYDLILEQTFFCALEPDLREAYINKMYDLLSENGKIVGLLFASHFPMDGPPYGGELNEYKQLFQTKLHIKTIDMCYNSVKPRNRNELFFICEKLCY